jgi:hypothetical protein
VVVALDLLQQEDGAMLVAQTDERRFDRESA